MGVSGSWPNGVYAVYRIGLICGSGADMAGASVAILYGKKWQSGRCAVDRDAMWDLLHC